MIPKRIRIISGNAAVKLPPKTELATAYKYVLPITYDSNYDLPDFSRYKILSRYQTLGRYQILSMYQTLGEYPILSRYQT